MSRAQSRISPPPPVHHRDYGADWVQDEEAALARPRDLDGAGQDLVTSSEVREQRILQVLPSATEQNPFLQLGFRNRIASNFLSSSDDVKDRRDRVESTLEPLFDVAPFVLMCTGESDNAVIMPVALGENADPVDQWTAIQRAAWKCRSRWRSLVGPARLELVKIRVVGQHHSRRDTFRGFFEPVDVAARLSLLRENASVPGLYTTEPPGDFEGFQPYCYHNTSRDYVFHSDWCFDDHHTMPDELPQPCDVEVQWERLREISKLELISTWPMLLADPSLARGNDLLLEEWIYYSTNILPSRETKVLHSAAQVEFTGFRLSEWPYTRWAGTPGTSVVGGMVAFSGIIVAARVIHGDWGVAYTAGAFFVALAGVLSTWVAWRTSLCTGLSR
ncbi:hypothetical protein CT0861_02453 [Colletotrichum tofieldiae]|uniref:Uncharacterized protein n=1 Tax=Colletotrichum tofieldiae TaxID=708197 RepID=A0A166Y7N8_9PEZI|nr:hypothetical protein CT0861_02453 [Colletotrichum tofieldiae]